MLAPFFGEWIAMPAITPESYAQAGTEHAEQVALFIWCSQHQAEYPELQSLFAIPNGGERAKIVASRLKAEGVKRGVSDLFLPLPISYRESDAPGMPTSVKTFAGLWIEMKRKRAPQFRNSDPHFGATSEERAFIVLMKSRGYAATVCHGWEEARDVLTSYLKMRIR